MALREPEPKPYLRSIPGGKGTEGPHRFSRRWLLGAIAGLAGAVATGELVNRATSSGQEKPNAAPSTPEPQIIPTQGEVKPAIAPTGTATRPASTATSKPTETPPATATRPATATAVPKEFPTKVEAGQLAQFTEPSSIQTMGKEAEKTDYELMGFSLAFTDLDSTTIQKVSGQSGDYLVIDVKKPMDFQTFVSNCPVFSSNDYLQRVDPFKITAPVISVTTQEELAQARRAEPRMAPTFTLAFPAKGDRTLRELVLYPSAGSDYEWKAKPSDVLQNGGTIVTVNSGKFVFEITDHYQNRSFRTIADSSYFVKVGNKLAVPNTNLASGK